MQKFFEKTLCKFYVKHCEKVLCEGVGHKCYDKCEGGDPTTVTRD